jgi:hypothetical protein
MATLQDNDIWYVRLPNGRVMRSRNTISLRYHVRRGRIPPDSRVRRSKNEAWLTLQEVAELSEAVAVAAARANRDNGHLNPLGRMRSRTAFQEARLLGVRGLVRELLDALDSSLNRAKLGIACLLGMLGAVSFITWNLLYTMREEWWWALGASAWAVVVLLAACLGISTITQYTAVELSKMRRPLSAELWPSVLGQSVRLAAALLFVVGGGVGLILFFRWFPTWLTPAGGDDPWWGVASSAALVLRLILEVVFWPVIALAPLLLSPILVVRDQAAWTGVREWWRLLRQHLGRIFLYEALATTLAAIFTVPLLIPIGIASWSMGVTDGVVQAAVIVLAGIALTPLIAYLLVANVFIYLNLRFEFFHSAR